MASDTKNIGSLDALFAALSGAIEAGGGDGKPTAELLGRPEFRQLLDELRLRHDEDAHKAEAFGALQARPPARALYVSQRAGASDAPSLYLAAARAWLAVYAGDGPDQDGARYTVASKVLGDRPADDLLAREDRAVTPLAKALQQGARAVLAPIEAVDPPGRGPECAGALDRCLWMHLETLGEVGQGRANELAAKSAERATAHQQGRLGLAGLFRLWTVADDAQAARFALVLAEVLWLAEVRPSLEHESTRPKAIIRPVYASHVMLMHTNAALAEDSSGQITLSDTTHGGLSCRVQVAHIDARAMARIRSGLDKFGTLTAHRLIRWEIETGYRQWVESESRPGVDFRKIEVVGGYSAIAQEHLKLASRAEVDNVREIIAAQDACVFDFPWANLGAGHTGRLLTLEEEGATRGRRAVVRLILGSMLLPNYSSALKRSRMSGETIKLVPMTDIPPLIGRDNEKGAQVSLSMLLVLEMRDRATEMYEEGSILLRPAELRRLSASVGIRDEGRLQKLWDRWQHDGDDAPAFVKREGPDRYTLADAHDAARRSILEAGAEEVAGRLNGRKSQKQKRVRRDRALQGTK